jgi:DNA-binding response OmpR family regulator
VRQDGEVRVLVVEDQVDLADDIGEGLRDQGIGADVAYDGATGIEKALMNRYDVVVLDRDLPKVHGDAVCAALVGASTQSRILMLTAATAVDDRVEGLNLGADDYLTKPFAFAELLVRVKALLRRGPVSRSSVVRVCDLELDRLSQQVRRSGKRIDLTSKEYSLLEYLVSNAGRVLSRTMIVEHVWDQSFNGVTNIVDVYVRHLRVKIDDPFEQKLIRTVRGVGYTITQGAHA